MTQKAMHTHDTSSTANKAYLVYTKESPLFRKLPRFANSSLLFLAARSCMCIIFQALSTRLTWCTQRRALC